MLRVNSNFFGVLHVSITKEVQVNM